MKVAIKILCVFFIFLFFCFCNRKAKPNYMSSKQADEYKLYYIFTALQSYAKNNSGSFPDSLENKDIFEIFNCAADIFISAALKNPPASPGLSTFMSYEEAKSKRVFDCSWGYISNKTIYDNPKSIIVFTKECVRGAIGRHVLLVDGTILWLSEDEFKKCSKQGFISPSRNPDQVMKNNRPPSTDVKTENDTAAEQGNQPERAGD